MQDKIEALKTRVTELSAKPEFVHHKWFAEWHLAIVERIALELCDHHPEADRDLVTVMAWMHDYGKIIDFDNEYTATIEHGPQQLIELGFDEEFAHKVIDYIEILDKKLEVDLHLAPIEVQIVSTADGCSHMASPFVNIFWHEATDATFAGKTFEELMELNAGKLRKDWDRKIVLPEAREAFAKYHEASLCKAGVLPDKFLA